MKKKKILYSVLALIVLLVVLFAFNREKATQIIVDFGMAMTSSVKHRDPSTEKAKFAMNAEAFSKAFKDNPAAANKLYINQAVLIDGAVTNISGVTVTLGNIACNVDSTQLATIKNLKPGSNIKIQGLVVGYNDLMEEVSIAQCSIK